MILLNILHETIVNIAIDLLWNETFFLEAYNKCIENDFQLVREYPSKKSRDRTLAASMVIKKDEQTTYTYIKIVSATNTRFYKIFETNNYNCYDVMYRIAKRAKWIDKDRFGFTFKSNEINIFYDKHEKDIKMHINPPVGNFDELPEEYSCFLKATTEKTDINPFYFTSIPI